MAAFEQAFSIVVASEGGFTSNPADPGNWTGGRVGAGVCRGTNWGISAAAFPALDIAALTQPQAQAIYQQRYWDAASCGLLPAPLALLVFDAAVNNGVDRSARWLQTALGVPADGKIGQQTRDAVTAQAGNGAALCASVLALRIDYMARLPTWPTFGAGWAKRLARLPFQAMTMEA